MLTQRRVSPKARELQDITVQSTSIYSTAIFILLIVLIQATGAILPSPNYAVQFTAIDEKILYVHGGSNSPGGLFSLDLTQNFNDTSPPWTALAAGPTIAGQSMTNDVNTTHLFLWNMAGNYVTCYTIASNEWTRMGNISTQPYDGNMQVVTDQDTDILYMANGRKMNGRTCVITYNAATDVDICYNIPAVPVDLQSSAAVWSTHRRSMLVYGGAINGSAVSTFYEYITGTRQWLSVNTTGTDPGNCMNPCMAVAYSGTNVIVFGGKDGNNYHGGIYILDLTTMTWTAGAPLTSPRASMACAVAGDNFLVWGGQDAAGTVSTTPIIYNMKTNQWVHEFIIIPPPNVSTSSTGVSSSTPTSTGSNTLPSNTTVSSHGSNIGAIGGGVAAVVVVAAIGVFIFFRRKRSRQQVLKVDKPSRNETSRDSPLSDGDYQFNAMRSPSSAPQPTLSSKSFHIDRSLEADAKTGYSYYSRPRPPRPQESFPSQFSYGRNGPQSGVLSSQPSQNDIGYVSDPIGRNPQGIPYQQPDGAFQYYAGPQPHSVAAPHTSARVIAGGYRASQLGAPHVLPRHSQQPLQHPSSISMRDSDSTYTSSSKSPSTAFSNAIDSKAELAKRQIELMQIQHAVNLEKFQIEQEMKSRQRAVESRGSWNNKSLSR